MHALVVGGGIGGLAAALALQQAGWRTTVCEAVRTMRPLGVGINLLPHGISVLWGLGLEAAVTQAGIPIRTIEYRTRFGHLLSAEARGIEAGFAFPQIAIHRGALQFILRDAFVARAGAGQLRTGHRATGFEATGTGVTGCFDTHSGPVRIDADILVGADGFHSMIRRQLHPNEGPAHAEGMVMYRGACEWPIFGDGRTMVVAGNHDLKFVCYPISTADCRAGHALINWVAEVRIDAPRSASDADWMQKADRSFIEAFRDFQLPGLDVVNLMQATPDITVYPMIDRDPLPYWGRGPVTLLGDAAHPMYPIGANGTSQALLDSAALTSALAGTRRPEEALAAYEADRLPATRDVVLANRQAGPERVLDIADARLTGPSDRVEDLITPEESAEAAARYRRIAGFQKAEDEQ